MPLLCVRELKIACEMSMCGCLRHTGKHGTRAIGREMRAGGGGGGGREHESVRCWDGLIPAQECAGFSWLQFD